MAVQCSDELKAVWSDLRMSELWLEVTCGDGSMLQGRLGVVFENGEEVESW